MRLLVAVFALMSSVATAAPFLVSDPTSVTRITHCAYTRGATTTLHPVEAVTGGVRCRIDLASDPRTPNSTVTVAFHDAAMSETGPASSFTFPAALPATQNLRLVPN